MTIGERIREKRLEKKMSLDDLAKIANVARQTIYKYENNIITTIPTDKVESIAIVLGVSPGYLMGWEENSARTSYFSNSLGAIIQELRGNSDRDDFIRKCGIDSISLAEVETGESMLSSPITADNDILNTLHKIADKTEYSYDQLKRALLHDVEENAYYLPKNRFYEVLRFIMQKEKEAENLIDYVNLNDENRKTINDMIELLTEREMKSE